MTLHRKLLTFHLRKPTRRFQGWRIAIVVDVIYNSQDAGKGASLTLDLSREDGYTNLSELCHSQTHMFEQALAITSSSLSIQTLRVTTTKRRSSNRS